MDINHEIREICNAVESGRSVENRLLSKYLCSDDLNVRIKVNYELSRSYYFALGDIKTAITYARRAFRLSGLDEFYLLYYISILDATQDIEGKRSAYKEIGGRFAEVGNIHSSLRYFDLHRDVYASSGLGDQYEYDLDVLKRIENLSALFAHKVQATTASSPSNKIRLAYLVFGVSHLNSVIIAMLAQYAKHHNSSQFEFIFFIIESERSNSETELQNIATLATAGARIIQCQSDNPIDCYFEAASSINSYSPAILISTAVLANYSHYFVYSLVKNTTKIVYCFGPPEQYIPPDADAAICPTVFPAIESKCPVELIPIEFDLSQVLAATPVSRQSLGIPVDSVIIVSAGRPSKFLNAEFWNTIFEALDSCRNSYFVAIGLSTPPSFLAAILPAALSSRVKLLGWIDGYQKSLKIADIFVDTFPSGGGIVLIEAMACDIPVITFQEDYSNQYSQMNWNPGAEMVPVKELILPRFNFSALKEKLTELIVDPDRRLELGLLCGQEIRLHRSDPSRNVQRCEVFLRQCLDAKNAIYEERPSLHGYAFNGVNRNDDGRFALRLMEDSVALQREIHRLQQSLLRRRSKLAILVDPLGAVRLIKRQLKMLFHSLTVKGTRR